MSADTEAARLKAIVENQGKALNHWRRLSDEDAGAKRRLYTVIQEQSAVLRDCARMLYKHRGTGTEGDALLSRIDEALAEARDKGRI